MRGETLLIEYTYRLLRWKGHPQLRVPTPVRVIPPR